MSEREREMEWEREREREREREQAARGYPASGRITPKNEPGYARSQHGGSNAPSPAFGRPPVYGRDEGRDYYNNSHPGSGPGGPRGGYERGPGAPHAPAPGMRHDERGPPPAPFEHERGPPPPHQAGDLRYDSYSDGRDGPFRGPPPGLGRPTPDWERTRAGEYGPPSLHDGAEGRNAGGSASKSRRGPKAKDELEAAPAPPSPVPSSAGKKGKTTSSRAGSPWSAKGGVAAPGKNGKASTPFGTGVGAPVAAAGVGGGVGSKKGAAISLRPQEDQPDSRPGSPQSRRDASPASSDGSNEPLAARAPSSRMVDEDYDEGAADALMGLAGAASASSASVATAAPAPVSPVATSDRASSAEKRAESSLGKRPYAEEERAVDEPEDSYKRAKSGSAAEIEADATSGGRLNGVSVSAKPEATAAEGTEQPKETRTETPPLAVAQATSPEAINGKAESESAVQPMDVDGREPSKAPSESATAMKDSPSTANPVVAAKASELSPTAAPPATSMATSEAQPAKADSCEKNNNDEDEREEEEGQIHEDPIDAPAKRADEDGAK